MPRKDKEADKIYAKAYYLKNRQKIIERTTKYRQENREKMLVTRRQRYHRDDTVKNANKEWVVNNPDKVKAAQNRYLSANRLVKVEKARLHRKNNPESVALSQKKWHMRNAPRILEYSHRRRALQLDADDGTVNIQNLIDSWNGLCGICSQEVKDKYHIDHILPLSKGGLHAQVNLQITHPKCNLSKGSKILIK